ncbi:grim [Haematobia irritans]|uniref:grim n=1 Tax=Haematobia irritans TaxID=7368 RepID=UPI003F5002A7
MAIAYFIPDQAKLLAGRQQTRNPQANNQSNSDASQPSSNTQANPNPAAVNRGYGTTINLTVPTTSSATEPAGCWDFLTQVFCHALRFYHESSQIQPTVIQISVNFQSETATPSNDTTSTAENSSGQETTSTETENFVNSPEDTTTTTENSENRPQLATSQNPSGQLSSLRETKETPAKSKRNQTRKN